MNRYFTFIFILCYRNMAAVMVICDEGDSDAVIYRVASAFSRLP